MPGLKYRPGLLLIKSTVDGFIILAAVPSNLLILSLHPSSGGFGGFWRYLSYLDPFHVYLDPFMFT